MPGTSVIVSLKYKRSNVFACMCELCLLPVMCSCVRLLPSCMAGQVISRGKDVWLVRIRLGRDDAGRPNYLNKTIHGPRKAAQAWLNQRLTERDAGVAVKPAQQTLNEYLDRWLETAAKPKVRPKTLLGYRNLLDCHVRPALGARPLSKITPLEVQQAFQAMLDKGLSARTIEYTRMVLKQAFKQAIQWRLLTFNPCEGVPIPRRERREMQALSPEQARRFLAVARGTLSVVRSLDAQPGGGYRLEETKTRNSRRAVSAAGRAERVGGTPAVAAATAGGGRRAMEGAGLRVHE